MQFKSYYNYQKSNGITFTKPSLTQQHFANECNINTIIAKYRSTGIVSHLTGRTPLVGDFTAIGDFTEHQNKLVFAQESFEQLSSTIRKRFHNDPAEFMEFVQNPKNQAEAVSLGICAPPEPVVVPPTSPVSPVPPASPAPAVAPKSA